MDFVISEFLFDSSSDEYISDSDIEILFSSTDSSSSSGFDSVSEHDEYAMVNDFINTINSFSNKDFKRHFHLNRSTVNHIIEMYRESVLPQQNGGRTTIGIEKEIYVFLWYMANTNTFREIGNLFGICKSSAWNTVIKVCNWILTIAHNYIKWPPLNEITNIMETWERKKKIQFVIGPIDCSHIKINAPNEYKTNYFNRKHYYSIHLQAVIDQKKKFIDIYVGEPGSLHDSRVLRKSELFKEAQENKESLFPNNAIILGDSAYPLLSWLIPPFKDNGNISNTSKQFNMLHSSARIVVENAFGILKTRFRRLLHFMEQKNIKLVINLTIAACVLHNICINENDDFLEEQETTAVDTVSTNLNEEDYIHNNRRDEIIDYLKL